MCAYRDECVSGHNGVIKTRMNEQHIQYSNKDKGRGLRGDRGEHGQLSVEGLHTSLDVANIDLCLVAFYGGKGSRVTE